MTGAGSTAGASAPFSNDSAAMRRLTTTALNAIDEGRAQRPGAGPAGAPGGAAEALAVALSGDPLMRCGIGPEAALMELGSLLAAGHTDPTDAACAAHLHCPPLAVAVAADLVTSVLNPSLDSWDQGPSALAAEARVAAVLCDVAGYDPQVADAVITTGATTSVITALHLARGRFRRQKRLNEAGIRILCSDQAHFSVETAADLLGIGIERVTRAPTGGTGVMDAAVAERIVRSDARAAWVVIATAGTTDLAAIDPLAELAALARSTGAWLHVDAAYGGGLFFSAARRRLVAGAAEADSIAMDTHKFGWQPAASGQLLVADRADLEPLGRQVAYLNPADDEEAGLVPRISAPTMTTRRADAFKLLVTFRALGVSGIGAMVDRCCELAVSTAQRLAERPALEVHSTPTISTVLFRPRWDDPAQRDAWCGRARRELLASGTAIIGQTELPGSGDGRRWLKLTLLHPNRSTGEIETLIQRIEAHLEATIPAVT